MENHLQKWLKKKVAVQVAYHLSASLISFGVGIFVIAATFFFTYAIIWFGFFGISAFLDLAFGKPLHHLSSHYNVITSLIFLVLLFIENSRTSREYLGSYSLKHRVSPGAVAMSGIAGALISLLANPDASGKIITDLLFSGPRLIMYSISALLKAIRFFRINVEGCATALMVLLKKTSRVSLNDLAAALQGRNPVNILFQLQEIEGVLFIGKDPAGITLTEDLRKELDGLFQSKSFEETNELATPEENSNYYELLGLSPPVSLAEIKAAYRKCIKQCHPDKFSGKGKEFQQLAEERSKAINAAYEALLIKHNAP